MVGKQIKREHTPDIIPLTVTTSNAIRNVRDPYSYLPIYFLDRSMVGTLSKHGTFVRPLDFEKAKDIFQSEPPIKVDSGIASLVTQLIGATKSYAPAIWNEIMEAAQAQPHDALAISTELRSKGREDFAKKMAAELASTQVSQYAWVMLGDESANSSLYLAMLAELEGSSYIISEITSAMLRKQSSVPEDFIFSTIGVLAELGKFEDIMLIASKASGIRFESKYGVDETSGARVVLCAIEALNAAGKNTEASELRRIWNSSQRRLKLEDEEFVLKHFECPYSLLFNSLQNANRHSFLELDSVVASQTPPDAFLQRLACNLSTRLIADWVFERFEEPVTKTPLYKLIVSEIEKSPQKTAQDSIIGKPNPQ